jgi:hypothetical protein
MSRAEAHPKPESRNWRQRIATPLLAGSLTVAAACGGTVAHEATPNRPQAPTTAGIEKPEAMATRLWSDAVDELRTKVATGQQISLLRAEGICMAWPGSIKDVYTVVRNPTLYVYEEGPAKLVFAPFVPSTLKREDMTIMNGPYMLYPDSKKSDAGLGLMSTVIYTEGPVSFEPYNAVVSLGQEPNPTPFTTGWLLAADGTKVSETQLVMKSELANAFGGDCHLRPEQLQPGPKTQTF